MATCALGLCTKHPTVTILDAGENEWEVCEADGRMLVAQGYRYKDPARSVGQATLEEAPDA